jgi:fumarate hydratase, class I
MTIIDQHDFIQSIESALQFISYYHPVDFIEAMGKAYQEEQSQSAKDAIAQILINSRMSYEGKRPMCQDTGIVCVFVDIGMEVKWRGNMTVAEMVNEGVRRAYLNPDNPLRASIVSDPAGVRKNTKDNTPAVVHINLVAGNKVHVEISAKGGGSEFKSKFTMLNPSDSIADWICDVVPSMGAGWCPPGVLGIGIGGTAEKAMLLAKRSLNESIDMQELLARGPETTLEKLRVDIYHRVNALGIGAQGLGGLTTVLDIKINDYPTHAVCLPVAVIPSCASTRHIHFELDGSGAAHFEAPSLKHWPEVSWAGAEKARHVNLDTLKPEDRATWKAGETLLLSGRILTGRDAAHKRIQDLISRGEALPVNFKGKFIYYVGPVQAVRNEVVGPAGPTTATRMDKFTDLMLDQVGVLGMIGKSERGPEAVQSIAKRGAVYLMAVGGAAYLISQSIKAARCVGFEDLGMEAIYEFEVKDMPVTVAVDSSGNSIHETGPALWKNKIAGIPVKEIKKY